MSRGRGRGRGRGISRSGLMDAISLPPGERLPPPILKPPPLYPQLERRPLEMKTTGGDRYLVALKQEVRRSMADSPFFIAGRSKTAKNTVVQSSDVVFNCGSGGANSRVPGKERNCKEVFLGWSPNWSLFPAELKPDLNKKKRKAAQPPPTKKPKRAVFLQQPSPAHTVESNAIVQSKLVGEDDKLEEDGEDDNEEEVVEYDEEEEEEAGDYTANYFDDGGEDYGGDEEDALEDKDGPCY